MVTDPAAPPTEAQLGLWVERGVITAEQADQLRNLESVPGEGAAPPHALLGRGAELAAYVGAVVAVTGIWVISNDALQALERGVQTSLALLLSASLTTAGILAWRARDRDPVFDRLAGVLWFFAVGATALTIGLWTSVVFEESERLGPAIVAGVTTVHAFVLYRLRAGAAQQIAMFFPALALLLTAFPWDTEAWIGGALIAFGLGWYAAAFLEWLPPAFLSSAEAFMAIAIGVPLLARGESKVVAGLAIALASALAWHADSSEFEDGRGPAAVLLIVVAFEASVISFGDSDLAPVIYAVLGLAVVAYVVTQGVRRARSDPH